MRIIHGYVVLRFLYYAHLAASLLSQEPLLKHGKAITTEDGSSWHFNFSSVAPHYFHSLHGLLQQWPNTFFPNGHNIAPCEVRAFTRLYHGRIDGDLPPNPEWLAFDM
jgi:hypothetical protein